MRVHYEKGDLVIRESVDSDIDQIADHMRKEDADEVMSSHGFTPAQALEYGFITSTDCMTIEYKGRAIGMFGIAQESLMDDVASIWFLSGEDICHIKKSVVKLTNRFVFQLKAHYKLIFNFVDARNTSTLRWLKFSGFEIQEAAPWGVAGDPFHYVFLRS